MVKERNINLSLLNIITVLNTVYPFILKRLFSYFDRHYMVDIIILYILAILTPYLTYLIGIKFIKNDGNYYKIKLLKKVIKINKDNYKKYRKSVIQITLINLALATLLLLNEYYRSYIFILNISIYILTVLAFNFKKRILSYLLLFIFILIKIFLIFAIVTVTIESSKGYTYANYGGLAIVGIVVLYYIPASLVNIVVNYITIGIQTYKENKENKIKYLNSINKQNEYEDIID